MRIEPQIQYAQARDDVSIAYWTMGEGFPVFVSSPLTFSHIALEMRIPQIAALYEGIASRAMLVRWDTRNYGMSERGVQAVTQEAWASDVLGVADKLGVPQFDMLAINYHPTVAGLEPGRVRRMVLVAPPPIRLADLLDQPEQSAVRSLAEKNWQVYTETLASFLQGWDPAPDVPYAHFMRESIEQADYLWQMAAWREFDCSKYLGRIECPTLVVSSSSAPSFSREQARKIAASVRHARLAEVEGALGLFNHDVSDIVTQFLEGGATSGNTRVPESARNRPPSGGLRTILFTDIVGHTEMMQRLGDAKGRDVLREHERITRQTLRAHGGAEVKTMGDGFLASFGSVTSAMECAISLQRAFAAHTDSMPEPLHVRVGLNAGEPIEEDGDLFGATVILASRIAAKAGAGEILVPDTVRGLLSGKGFVFVDRGEFVPKGFDEGVRLWDVRWQE